jgi:hypothetical protein
VLHKEFRCNVSSRMPPAVVCDQYGQDSLPAGLLDVHPMPRQEDRRSLLLLGAEAVKLYIGEIKAV